MTTMSNSPSLWQVLSGWAAHRLGVSSEARAVVLDSVHPSQDPPMSWLDSPALGVMVTPDTAMTNAAVYACVRVLAESVASLPLKLYRRRADGGKELATNHALYSVLHDLANSEITSFEMRETLMMHVALRGNAYCELDINGRGDVLGLWPITPWRVTMKRHTDGGLYYHVSLPQGGEAVLPQYRVWHIRGLSQNGLLGMSPVSVMRNAIGLALTTEQLGQAFYGNGATPGGVLEHPGRLGDQAYRRMMESWEGRHKGVSKANRIAILEEGMKYTSIGLSMDDAQFLQTRKFQKSEIASIFRVPPHMIGDLERATFSNIEQQSIDFVVNTLRPWLVRIEQSITRDLIGPIERGKIFAEFSVDGLLRGDIASRYNAYSIGRNGGWLSPNDVRVMENMNPIQGGDAYSTPLNMAPLGAAPPATDPNAARSQARGALEPIVRATLLRIALQKSLFT